MVSPTMVPGGPSGVSPESWKGWEAIVVEYIFAGLLVAAAIVIAWFSCYAVYKIYEGRC